MATVLISLGANTPDRHSILHDTILAIEKRWEIIAQTPVYDTPAEGNMTSGTYANALVCARVNEDYNSLRHIFKGWESEAGRTPEMKLSGIVPLDIDIIMWDDTVIKERDMKMNYMKKGLKLLSR